MEFDAVLLPPRRAESVARRYWLDRTINDDLDARLAHCPDKLALIAVRRESGEVRRLTYRELAKLADRLAVRLSRLGVGRTGEPPMTAASRSLATALWGARFASGLLRPSYTTWRDATTAAGESRR